MALAEHPTSEENTAPAPHWPNERVVVVGNELTLFEESISFIAAMVADIRQARERVWLESYIIVDDEAGQAVAEALLNRAAAGLDVPLCTTRSAACRRRKPISIGSRPVA